MFFSHPRLKKIFFRCSYRGTKEMEILLTSFALQHLKKLDDTQLDALEHILDQSDADLHSWIIGRKAPPDPIDSALIDHIVTSHPPS